MIGAPTKVARENARSRAMKPEDFGANRAA